MINEADAVVIGSGSLGSSTAFYLSQRGKRVALVDKFDLTSQTSPRAAGMAMQIQIDDVLAEIAIGSIKKLLTFNDETGEDLTVHVSGSIKYARTPADATQVQAEVERGKQLGVEVDFVTAAEAERLAPHLNPSSAVAMWYAPGDLYLEPGDLPRAYWRAAERLGARLLPHTEVTGISAGTGEHRVTTTRGEIRAPVVVDAAGAWTRMIADMAGIHVPLIPTRHQIYITEPLPGVTPRVPTVRIMDAKVYVRPAGNGLMVGGYESDPLQFDLREQPADFQIAEMPLDFSPLETMTKRIRDEFPSLPGAPIAEFRGGLPTMTPDGYFIVDQAPGIPGLFTISGCNVGGLSTSPVLGETLAGWIVEGQPMLDLSAFRLTRFGPEMRDEQTLRAACFATYAHKYDEEETVQAGARNHVTGNEERRP
jgi:glycine/D-amino acid oxidase-like deaminating enzyme